ncbi:unnamed protein product [Mytilus coruscus]|uniref:Methyltransferase domain-containing protein n=1 Tax=Mytilus coruscus TaxID=42192 RepID=A0A6J8C7A9_MYTCO|nr:unnamed protein product [Mytilus coruscus]
MNVRGGICIIYIKVSGWTKLCEVELPDTVAQLVNKIRNEESTIYSLPEDIMKLEWHFLKPAKIHNDDKTKRPFLKKIQKEADNLVTDEDVSEFQYHREIHNPHGVTKFYVNVNSISETKMTIDNLEFSHLYSEGITITMADLILYTNIYHLFESLDFKIASVQHHLNHIITWFDHMTSLPRVHQTAIQCGYKLGKLTQNRNMTSPIEFTVEEGLFEKINEDEMELSRRCRGKYRPIKPDVWSALDKVVKGEIKIETGRHPRGDNTAILWSEVPEGVDPGLDLPKKRLLRKCEQLENLVTAVLELAKPGDVIVDFCSGGGHLGIAVAHFLPECTVYLIENKEESLIRAKQRIDKLNMKNVVIYQCNQDYFRGKFDIGMCLHACGVATDMVLKQCLQNNASFVICPCCYGGIQNTHLMTYPTSRYYKDSGIVYKDFLTLGHAADQTEFNLVLEEQGMHSVKKSHK